MHDAGFRVVVTHSPGNRNAEGWNAEMKAKGYDFRPVPVDVSDYDSCVKCAAHIEKEVGPIDILVNNSGVTTTQRLTEVTAVDYDFVFNTNTRGAFFVAQEVAKRMIARSRQAQDFRGRIVNIASVSGLRPVAQIGVYSMSKAAVVQMTRAQALEWGRYGINVNALCPGYIRTEINEDYWDTEGGRKLIQILPRKRVGLPEDLDAALLLLVADESQFINGAILAVDDGMSIA
jgi:NAD(P)-dependent dehydrogenase (short-subunit alcohol dehydrogenase family)